MSDEEQTVKINENRDANVDQNDLVGHDRPTVDLGERDEIGGDGAIDRDRCENKAGQVSERVDEKGNDATEGQELCAHVEVEIGD